MNNQDILYKKHYSIFYFSLRQYTIFITTSLLLSIGILLQMSVGGGSFHPFASHQFNIMCLAIILGIILYNINHTIMLKYANYIYFTSILILLMVLIIGQSSMGATRWINIIGVTLQPSEFVKISLILALAKFFHYKSHNQISRISYLLIPITMVSLPLLLVLLQPNLGTSLIIFSMTTAIFFSIGIRMWKFALLAIVLIIAIPISWNYLLHDYQKKRITMFLHPESDPLGSGYNLIQSKIAIGSGGLWGKGLFSGTQNQLKFLPEKHTDFIFTVLCEEAGFVIAVLVILLYMILIISIMIEALKNHCTFYNAISVGVSSMIFFHMMMNISMITGLIPVVGVPLPFLSYGGSNMISSILGIALVIKYDSTHISIKNM